VPANRLLIIDDDPDVADLVSSAARRTGYEVEAKTEPAPFLDRLSIWQPTVVMLDLQMPIIDGVELLRTLGGRRTTAKIIIASGVEGRVVDAARRLGKELGLDVVATLLKPYRTAELRQILEQLAIDENWCTAETIANAIERRDMVLLYQPKVALRDGEVLGYEALVRWQHARHGLVPPQAFIPIAESSGMILRLTQAVIDRGLAEVGAWGSVPTNALSINISAQDLADLTFADRLAERCRAAGVDPNRIVLELTETSAMADGARGIDIMTRLRLKGFRLSIDDFGTGYSSLLQLARLPFSELKIDKTFVLELRTSPEARAIVRSTIDLAHNLGLRAVAEGVETTEVRMLLRELGCDTAQGYGIGRPMLPDQIPSWLSGWEERGKHEAPAKLAMPMAPPEVVHSPWTKSYDGSEEVRSLLSHTLAERINPLWGLGRNSLIGWRPADGGIDVLMVPYQKIVDHFNESQRLLHGRRLMGAATFRQAVELSSARPVHIPLPFRISDDDEQAVPTEVVEQVLRRYGITQTNHRAVALFDIVGFSRCEPSQQIAQLNSLECSINTAQEVIHALGKAVDVARTTTGDGFYIWNRQKGALADLDTYLLTLLTVADNAIALRDGRPGMVPRLRTCFSVGPHYSYHQVEGLDPRGHDYIVGHVTIGLARMAAKCLPGQILVGDFTRPTDLDTDPTNPLEFVINADGAFARYNDIRLHGRTVTGIRCYLTGEARDEGEFDVTRYRIRDKHGLDHHVFNQKFNVYLTDEPTASAEVDTLYLGRQRTDLADFEAVEATKSGSAKSPADLVPSENDRTS
jgi:EAL domain-containing protein (putative c-di-GMP-specific phosphodiesterase class I)/CheY-like chemotaxis protein